MKKILALAIYIVACVGLADSARCSGPDLTGAIAGSKYELTIQLVKYRPSPRSIGFGKTLTFDHATLEPMLAALHDPLARAAARAYAEDVTPTYGITYIPTTGHTTLIVSLDGPDRHIFEVYRLLHLRCFRDRLRTALCAHLTELPGYPTHDFGPYALMGRFLIKRLGRTKQKTLDRILNSFQNRQP